MHPLVRALLEHGVEPGGQRQHALAGAGRPAEADDADLVVGQQVDGDALLGGPAAHVEQRAVAADQVDPLVVVDPPEGRLAAGVQRDARCCTAGRGPRRGRRRGRRTGRRWSRRRRRARRCRSSSLSLASSLRYSSASRPTIDALSRSGRSLVTTVTSRPSAARLRATARMRWSLSSPAQRRREPGRLGVVELDPQRAALLVGRHRPQQRAVLEPQVLEHPQRLAGRPAELGVVALAPRAR